jgi:hypothetical protein
MAMSAARGRREPTIPYQVSRRTSWPGPGLLADIAALDVPGVEVVERGSTYLVLAPGRPGRYGPGLAVALAIVTTIAVLALSATTVVLVALLPLALLPLVPLLFTDSPRLAIGAVPETTEDGEDRDTVVTVSGDMWHALAVPLHSYLSALPPPARTARPAGED